MATLRAVSVGLPKDVPWQGRTVRTGVWKQPVNGPVLLRRLNLDGDGQGDLAGHGGEQRAVLVYQVESYRHWRRVLARDDLTFGQFGENFTVEGLSDDEVRIGNRYRVGAAVVEVTQPRVTCYRVGLRLNEPRMPALMVAHHRPGFYLRVLTEGHVQAGDELVKIAEGPEPMTVAQIDALLYLPGSRSRDDLSMALRIPALSPGWKSSMRALLDQGDDRTGNAGLTATSPPPAWTGFRPLTVTGVQDESQDVFSVRLASPDGSPLPAALPGQFLTVRLAPGDGAAPIIRSYSLSSRPGDEQYRVSVKQEPHGAASGFLRTHARVGAPIDVAAPRGTFTLNDDGPALLLSAGIGATPVLAMLHALAATRSTREIWWVHGARNSTLHPFAAEVRALLAGLPNHHTYIGYSRPAPGDRPGHDYTAAGRIDAEVLAGLHLPAATTAYVCGPSAFMQEVAATLVTLGFGRDRIHTELFAAGPSSAPGVVGDAVQPPHPPTGPPGTGPAVSFARSGLTVAWDDTYASLLDFAEACAVPVRWSCRTGVCHNCESGLLAGTVSYSPDPVEPPGDGSLLICCARPRTELVLDL